MKKMIRLKNYTQNSYVYIFTNYRNFEVRLPDDKRKIAKVV